MIDLFGSYCSEIAALVDRNELNSALGLISRIAELIARSEASSGQVFSSPKLDDICQRIGTQARTFSASIAGTRNVRRTRDSLDTSSGKDGSPELIVYVASELYLAGGHTRLLENMIRLQPNRSSHVFLTNPFDREPAAIVPDFIAQATNNIEVAAIGSSHLDKLNWLQKRLEELTPDAIVLLTHHHDAVAVAAPDCKSMRTVFIHHSDHKFTLGTQMADAIHVDLQPRRFFACKQNGIANNRYWPVTLPDLGARASDSIRRDISGLTTCSSGSELKFLPQYEFSYFDEVAHILARSGGRHIHIGQLDDARLHQIRQGLAANGIPQESFVHFPWVRSVWKTLVDENVGLYVASFPIFSAGATIEALGSGTPVLAHVHRFASCFSDVAILYPGCLAWRTREELYRTIESTDTNLLRQHATTGREWYERYFRMENFHKCLDTLVEGEANTNPFVPSGGDPDPLAAFLAVGKLNYSAHLKLHLAEAFGRLGLATQANACLEEIMQLDQAVALAYFQAGNSRFSARDFKSATALFSKAAEIMPGTPLYLNGLAGALYETGEIDLALRHLEQALRILPDYPEARQNLALILQRRADRQD